jgi:hypothetical protein
MKSHPEIGRELKVSELRPRTIVWLAKEGRPAIATMWVIEVSEIYVHFRAGAVRTEFYAKRRGPDLEEITDDDNTHMRMFEYLGEP